MIKTTMWHANCINEGQSLENMYIGGLAMKRLSTRAIMKKIAKHSIKRRKIKWDGLTNIVKSAELM